MFSAKEQDRFHGIEWKLSPNGVPLLRGSAALFDCQLAVVVDAGDHAIFLGEVLYAESPGGKPLLYYDRDYHSAR